MNRILVCVLLFGIPCMLLGQDTNEVFIVSDSVQVENQVEEENQVEVKSNRDKESIILFKGNEWIRAEIIELNKENVFVKHGDYTVRIKMSEVYRIYPSSQDINDALIFLEDHPYYTYREISEEIDKRNARQTSESKKFTENIYNVVHLSLLTSKYGVSPEDEGSRSSLLNGVGLDNILGYRLHRSFGLGIGVGFYNYFPDFLSSSFRSRFFEGPQYTSLTIPFFVEARGDLSDGKIRPYYSVAFGFTHNVLVGGERKSFPKRLEIFRRDFPGIPIEIEDIDVPVGLYFQPSIGLKLKAKSLELLIDIGVQSANLNFFDVNVDSDCIFSFDCANPVSEVQEKVRRVVLRVGILL